MRKRLIKDLMAESYRLKSVLPEELMIEHAYRAGFEQARKMANTLLKLGELSKLSKSVNAYEFIKAKMRELGDEEVEVPRE